MPPAPVHRSLTDMDRYVYGTTVLGFNDIPFDDRVSIAREALDTVGWIHTSHTYRDALSVLRAAQDQRTAPFPPAIIKICDDDWERLEQGDGIIHKNIDALGVSKMEVGQLCLNGEFGEQYRNGGAVYDYFRGLKEKGLVGRYIMEVWPWSSDIVVDALKAGYPGDLVDAYIFYCNPLQRFVSNELWDLLSDTGHTIIAMRTVCGGSVHRLRDVEGSGPDYLRARAAQVAPIYDRSGCGSWTEFCVRFALGIPNNAATVGATLRSENLHAFLQAAESATPLPDDIQAEILALHRTWYDDHDKRQAPGSM